VTVNNYLALRGDGFTALKGGTKPQVGVYDDETLFAYFRANSPISPAVPKRITRIN
jgi:5'-nucleotidase